jgi:protein pelota
MKVLVHDPKTNYFRLRLENSSDLWRLSQLVQKGDIVGAFTHRRDPEAPMDTPNAQKERRPVFLKIRVEQIEFHEFTGHLRFTGPIVEAPFDIGRHHTLDIEEGGDVSLNKEEVTGSDWALIDEGKHTKEDPVLIIVCLDWSEGALARIHGRSVEVVVEVSRRGTGKYVHSAKGKREKEDEEYLDGFIQVLEREAVKAKGVVIAGPGFCKEELIRRWAEEGKGPAPTIASASEAGLPGVNELLRSGRAENALKGYMAVEEASQVERVVQALGKEGLGAVGPKEVSRAVNMGAVEVLLVLDTRLHETDIARLIGSARQGGAKVLLVRHEGEPGKRLLGLGGIAATLRYKLPLA